MSVSTGESPGGGDVWRRLVELTTPLLFSWTRHMRLQEADAQDLVQEVLAVLSRRLPEFDYDHEKSFRGWLRVITVNKYRESLRGAAPVREDDCERFWRCEFQGQLVARALGIMQSDFRETTWRACWEAVVSGRSAAEIAAELGMTEVAVWSAKSKVLKRLRKELEGMMD